MFGWLSGQIKKVIAGTDDAAQAGAKAALASRTNTLFSFPMLYFMIYSAHISDGKNYFYEIPGVAASGWNMPALYVGTAIILAIEANAIFGKMRKFMESVKAVIHSGLILTVLFALLVYYYWSDIFETLTSLTLFDSILCVSSL